MTIAPSNECKLVRKLVMSIKIDLYVTLDLLVKPRRRQRRYYAV